MWHEFKKFALKSSMIDLAIGVIIGGAIGRVITSLVNDILMPPIGLLLGRVNFTSLYIDLGRTKYPTFELAKAVGAPTINIGIFLNAVIDFLFISLVIFFMVRAMNRVREMTEKKVAAPGPVTTVCPFCKMQIPIDATRCPHCTSELTVGA
ncbi:MAG: large conductance mechanosensitive channel protein MscL [Caldiserica bacterium]|nr:large conductance mechanosensitive channel protein MscL [Caldisericota bacterium]